MTVKQLARILIFVTSAAFTVGVSLTRRETETAYSSEDQEAILEAHNDYRRMVSPQATNMAEMVSKKKFFQQRSLLIKKCFVICAILKPDCKITVVYYMVVFYFQTFYVCKKFYQNHFYDRVYFKEMQ